MANVRNITDEMEPDGPGSTKEFHIGPLLSLAAATAWSRQQNTPDWVTDRAADSRARVEPAAGHVTTVSGKWTSKVQDWIRE